MWSVALASPARLTSSIFGLAVAISCGAPHHSLLVTVTRAGQPWPGVVVTLRSPGTDRVAASAATGADGTARLDKLDPGPFTVEALAIEDDRSAYCIVTLDVRQAESALHLRAESDFIVGGALRAFPAAVDAAPAGAAAETSERAARAALVPAVLEIVGPVGTFAANSGWLVRPDLARLRFPAFGKCQTSRRGPTRTYNLNIVRL